jgi:hypothetical protein
MADTTMAIAPSECSRNFHPLPVKLFGMFPQGLYTAFCLQVASTYANQPASHQRLCALKVPHFFKTAPTNRHTQPPPPLQTQHTHCGYLAIRRCCRPHRSIAYNFPLCRLFCPFEGTDPSIYLMMIHLMMRPSSRPRWPS